MSSEKNARQAELEAKLQAVGLTLRNEMRARGFDPDQEENVALTAPLAKLHAEREQLRSELELLIEDDPLSSE